MLGRARRIVRQAANPVSTATIGAGDIVIHQATQLDVARLGASPSSAAVLLLSVAET
jgi:hypothetical protein